MSTFNKAGVQPASVAGSKNADKSKSENASSGGKPADPMLKPKPQTTPTKK